MTESEAKDFIEYVRKIAAEFRKFGIEGLVLSSNQIGADQFGYARFSVRVLRGSKIHEGKSYSFGFGGYGSSTSKPDSLSMLTATELLYPRKAIDRICQNLLDLNDEQKAQLQVTVVQESHRSALFVSKKLALKLI